MYPDSPNNNNACYNIAYEPDNGEDIPFKDIKLEDSIEHSNNGKKKKTPRRVLHFSDGIVEEYSTDEDEVDQKENPVRDLVDPQTLQWGPWFWFQMVTSSTKTLAAVDFCGGKIASFLGILDSRYQYAINTYHRDLREEQLERKLYEQEQEVIRQREAAKLDNMESGEPTIQVISPISVQNSDPIQQNELEINAQI